MKVVLEHGERLNAAEVWQRYVDGPRGWAICKSTLKAGRNEGTHGGERASFRIEYSVRFVLKDLMFLRVYKTKIVSAGCHRYLGSCVVYSCRSPSPLSITTGLAVSRSPRLYVHAPVCRGCAGNGCSQTRSRVLASPTRVRSVPSSFVVGYFFVFC